MSFAEGKEFVINDVFANVLNMEEEKDYWGEEGTHFRIPWKMEICKIESNLYIYLKCLKTKPVNFSIENDIKVRISQGVLHDSVEKETFLHDHSVSLVDYIEFENVKNLLVDGKLTVEMHVKILKTTGFKEKIRNFDDESAKKFSDVALIVDDEKFYVCKKFLAFHSSYFEALFTGNFEESKQSEITLKDVDPLDFQDFLELIHGVSDVDDETVEGILKLADMYGSKTTIHRCEKFLTENSKQSLKRKFQIAIKYKMDELKKKCMTEIKTKEDILAVLPQDVFQLQQPVWAELLHKCISLK